VQVPAPLYGPYEAADRHARAWVRRLSAGKSQRPIDDEKVDIEHRPGLLLLNQPPAILRKDPHAHCALPMMHLKFARTREQVGQDVEDGCFRDWLTADWSLVGLLAQINVMWFSGHPERFRPFLDAVVAAWPTLYGLVGPRYSVGSVHGQDLWTVSSNLKYVLANMGVPTDPLRAPLPRGGLDELVEPTRSWDGVPVVDRQRP
jgi:hypothetical protein